MIEIEKSTVEIGLEKPLKILHITDSHLPFYCEDDTEQIKAMAATRQSGKKAWYLAKRSKG